MLNDGTYNNKRFEWVMEDVVFGNYNTANKYIEENKYQFFYGNHYFYRAFYE